LTAGKSPVAIERNKTALEFETMLRRHLKSGGAPVAACAGFDFDAASAYLENALGESHRAGFESHLAGCATCRCHLIELARLAQTAPRAETRPATVADQTPAWLRWRGVAAGWFDLSSWNFKWQIAGVAGAAFAILIAALGLQSWRQASYGNQSVVIVNTAAPASMEVSVSSPTPEASPQDQSFNAGAESAAAQPDPSRVPVPALVVGPSPGDITVPTPSNDPSKLNQNPQSGILQFDPPLNSRQDTTAGALQNNVSRGQAFQITPTQNNNFAPTQNVDIAGNASKQSPSNLGGGSLGGVARANQESAESAGQARIAPPGINQVNTGPVVLTPRPQTIPDQPGQANPPTNTPELPGKTQPEKSRLSKTLTYITEAINPLPPVKPDIKKEAQTLVPRRDSKPESTRARPTPKPADDESAKPLKHRIRDKVFVYHRDINMWIDEAYRKETMEFRLLRLERGSKAYEDVLARDPQLREFFDHGPILVVWKNKVYRVK
jgi:hypothetical protein